MDSDSLRKILDLEQKKGYGDSAVFGGLDKFLLNWSDQAAGSIGKPVILRRFRKLFNANYAAMTREQRREWMDSVLSFITDMEVR